MEPFRFADNAMRNFVWSINNASSVLENTATGFLNTSISAGEGIANTIVDESTGLVGKGPEEIQGQ